MTNGACQGYFIRDLPAAPTFALNQAFALEDDVGPDSYFVTGQQIQDYFDARYAPISDANYVPWDPVTGRAFNIATGSRILIGDATTGVATTAPDAILIGQRCGEDLVSGTGVVAIGTEALAENVTGINLTALGHQAGRGVIGNSHSNNTFLGFQCGFGITTGYSNLVAGSGTGFGITSGYENTLLGEGAGAAITTQFRTICIGARAGGNMTASGTTAIGDDTCQNVTDEGNLGVGSRALKLGTGSLTLNSVALGNGSMENILTATNMTSIGNLCFFGGSGTRRIQYSVGIGYRAGFSAQDVQETIVIGHQCAFNLTTGNFNVVVGANGLYYNRIGAANSVLGHKAGQGSSGNSFSNNCLFGYFSGYNLTTGGQNTFSGKESGSGFTSASGNVCLGNEVGKSNLGATTSNLLAIDNNDTDTPLIWGDMGNDNAGFNFTVGTDSVGASSQGVMFLGEVTTAPTGNPSGGGIWYVLNGALTYRGPGGTVTTIAPS